MPRQARGESIDPRAVQLIHCTHRCVRQAFLCGEDKYSGKSFEHRRGWIEERLKLLSSAFAIDCLTYSIVHNHLHVLLRTRPDIVDQWTDQEIAERWVILHPNYRQRERPKSVSKDQVVDWLLGDKDLIATIRERLSDVSKWMGSLAGPIARRANKEEGKKGHFWEDRFGSQLILDEAGLLACAIYVDLNPVRAALAETPETSHFTGAKARLDDLQQAKPENPDTHEWERSTDRQCSGWLSPVEINETRDEAGTDICPDRRRASRKGFLSMPLAKYLQLLDWTGRQIVRFHPGAPGFNPRSNRTQKRSVV